MNTLEDQLLDEIGFIAFVSRNAPQQIQFDITKIKRVGDVILNFQNPRLTFNKVKELVSSLESYGYDITKPVELGILTSEIFGSLVKTQIVLIDGETRMRAIFVILIQKVFLKKNKEREDLKDFLRLSFLPNTDQIIQSVNLVFNDSNLLEQLKNLLHTSFVVNGYLTTINIPSQIYERMLTSNKLTTPFCHWALSRMAETLLHQKEKIPEKIKRLFASEADIGEKRLKGLKEQGQLFKLLEGTTLNYYKLSEQDTKHIITFFRENSYIEDKKIDLLKNLVTLALGNETDKTVFKILVLSPYMNRGRLFKESVVAEAISLLKTYKIPKDISSIKTVKSFKESFTKEINTKPTKKKEFDFLKEWQKLIKEVENDFSQLENEFSVKFVSLNNYESDTQSISFAHYKMINQNIPSHNTNALLSLVMNKWLSLYNLNNLFFLNECIRLTERLIILLKLNPTTIEFIEDPYMFLNQESYYV